MNDPNAYNKDKPYTQFTVAQVNRNFKKIEEVVALGERVLITKHGKVIAAFIGRGDLAKLVVDTSKRKHRKKVSENGGGL